MTRPLFLAALPLFAAFAGCGGEQNEKDDVTIIGTSLVTADPAVRAPDDAQAIMLSATAQGLVRFDAAGQVRPALAGRWAIVDQGRSLIFRLDDGGISGPLPRWLTAKVIANRLQSSLIDNARNPLSPQFSAVESIRAVTPKVIEIRLKAARPEMLTLLAQPEAALLIAGQRNGTGPWKVTARQAQGWTLSRIGLKGQVVTETEGGSTLKLTVRAESSSRAIARYARGWTDLVLGGRFQDLPLLPAARIDRRQRQFDPAHGLFGLMIGSDSDFLRESAIRRALAMAVDRPALLRAFALPREFAHEALLPGRLAELHEPVVFDWSAMPQAERIDFARQQINEWAKAGNAVPRLRIALPPGHGSDLLFALLRQQWGMIGVSAERAEAAQEADLWLVDRIAPADTAAWYLRQYLCTPRRICDHFADGKLEEAQHADSTEARNAALSEAASSYRDTVPFIPLLRPVRWSLVNPALDGFTPNARAVHPLGELRLDKSRP